VRLMGLALGVLLCSLRGRRCRPRRDRPWGAPSSLFESASDAALFELASAGGSAASSALASFEASDALSFRVRPLFAPPSGAASAPDSSLALGALLGVSNSSGLALVWSSTDHFQFDRTYKGKGYFRQHLLLVLLMRLGMDQHSAFPALHELQVTALQSVGV
jgi:hypothetical protein